MFEKSLQDLVKGIRAHKRDPSVFISQCIGEIKVELNSKDMYIVTQAIRKLTFLQMMGYDMSWAAASVVQVMSSPKFAFKRIGYLAAAQSFTEETDMVLMCTNLFKKEFQSECPYEIGVAMNCMANILTPDLARDLLGDTVTLTSNQRAYVRKKSVLALYKLFTKYPPGLRLTFDQLKERLDDSDSSVVSCAAAAPKKEELDTAKVVQQMAALSNSPAGMPAMSGLLEGMYENWKEKIGAANKHEREQKKQFDATIAQLEAKKADAKKHGGNTETYDRIEKYWQRQRSISHRQYHTALKIMHSGMEQFKSVKGAMDDAIKGKKPTAKDLRAVGLAAPDVVFLQQGVSHLRAWAKDAVASLHGARELRADAI